MDTKLVGLLAQYLLLGKAVVESTVIESPMAQSIPLTACLRVELETIVLLFDQRGSYGPSVHHIGTYVHILAQLIYLMLQYLPEVVASIVHLL